MPSISALILGLVQGLTEFLPISSSGHLVIASKLLEYQSPGLILVTVVHIATTLAVIIYFRKRFASIIVGVFNDKAQLILLMARKLLQICQISTLRIDVPKLLCEIH